MVLVQCVWNNSLVCACVLLFGGSFSRQLPQNMLSSKGMTQAAAAAVVVSKQAIANISCLSHRMIFIP